MKMNVYALSLMLVQLTYLNIRIHAADEEPLVFVPLLIRNKEHTLPYFLKLFEELDYPKDRMILWIVSDGNADRSLEILNKWIPSAGRLYHMTFPQLNPSDSNELVVQWTPERHRHLIDVKEDALMRALELKADYIWYLDVDVFLLNRATLRDLIAARKQIVAPMLDSLNLYSNFWCGMGKDFYYERRKEYKPIRVRESNGSNGCHHVPLVHSNFLVDLNDPNSRRLTFRPEILSNYAGPHEDHIVFAVAADYLGIPQYVCNKEMYGFVMAPLEDGQTIDDDKRQLSNLKLEASVKFPPMTSHRLLTEFVTHPPKDRLGFDEIFMINLERRPERRLRMEWSFTELGIDFKWIKAVDGRTLNVSYVDSLGVRMLPNYADPHHKRPMKMGEIGCFLSHYNIWKEIVERRLERSIIFEDDIHFASDFRHKMADLVKEADRVVPDWDLIFIGRKILSKQHEPFVKGSDSLLWVGYTHWTLGYLLTLKGAEKLLAGEPLGRLIPVDEYLPIMYDRHPELRWVEAFPNRNLKALAPRKLLIEPTQYFDEPGYFSDTELSEVIPEVIRNGTDPSTQQESHQVLADINLSKPTTERRIEL